MSSDFEDPYGDAINLYISTSKLQDFFGVEDVDKIIMDEKQQKRTKKTRKKKTNKNNEENKKMRRGINRLKNGMKTARSRLSLSPSPRSKSSKSATSTPTTSTPTTPKLQFDFIDVNDEKKCLWRPTLSTIYKDNLLLNALTKYMEKTYCSENILFIEAVKQLNNAGNDEIDSFISSIYNLYIVSNAECQVNLSYNCYIQILSKRNELNNHTLDNYQKRQIFNFCVDEIEHLITCSILSSFYKSECFQSIAKHSIYYKPNQSKKKQSHFTSHSADSFLSVPSHHKKDSYSSISSSSNSSISSISSIEVPTMPCLSLSSTSCHSLTFHADDD